MGNRSPTVIYKGNLLPLYIFHGKAMLDVQKLF